MRHGRKLSFDEAYEEVVADSMEAILADGYVVQLMADMRAQDKTLWEKVRDWFKDLAQKLQAAVDAFRGVEPDSVEGKLVSEMQDMIVILESFYTDALLDAGESYQWRQSDALISSFSGVNTTSIKLMSRNEYPYNMATVIQEYLDHVNHEILDYAQMCRKNKATAYNRITIGMVTPQQVSDAMRLLNLDISEFSNAIEKSAINHVEKRHGQKGKADSSMSDLRDIARVGYIIENYDDVEVTADADGNEKFSKQFRDKNNMPAPMLKYSKKTGLTMQSLLALILGIKNLACISIHS